MIIHHVFTQVKGTGSEIHQNAIRPHWRESCTIERAKISTTRRETSLVLASTSAKMPADRKPMRFAHSEGHTDVCYDEKGE